MEAPVPACKCCKGPAVFFADYDFSRTCEDHKGPVFAKSGIRIPYYRCTSCGFVFTPYFDGWSKEMFAERIYNADYVLADPEIAGSRPHYIADQLTKMLGPIRRDIHTLDYGGGEGKLIGELKQRGFTNGVFFDPFFSSGLRPDGQFDLVTAYEVAEHAVDPVGLLKDALSFAAPDGALLFTTALQARKPDPDWWYIAPRNGHISIHTPASLQGLAASIGAKWMSLDDNAHVFYRDAQSAIARQIIGYHRTGILYAASKRGVRRFLQTLGLFGGLGFGMEPKDARHMARAVLASCGVL